MLHTDILTTEHCCPSEFRVPVFRDCMEKRKERILENEDKLKYFVCLSTPGNKTVHCYKWKEIIKIPFFSRSKNYYFSWRQKQPVNSGASGLGGLVIRSDSIQFDWRKQQLWPMTRKSWDDDGKQQGLEDLVEDEWKQSTGVKKKLSRLLITIYTVKTCL